MTAQQVADKIRKAVESKIRSIKQMDGVSVSVGFDPSARYDNGKTVQEVAKFVEYGTRYMPPRPFMRNAKSENYKSWSGLIRRAVEKSLKENVPVEILLDSAAERMKSDVQESIMDVGAYDTGLMHDSVVTKITAP